MTEDTAEEYIFDLFFEKIYGKASLGWPILEQSKVSKLLREAIFSSFTKSAIAEVTLSFLPLGRRTR